MNTGPIETNHPVPWRVDSIIPEGTDGDPRYYSVVDADGWTVVEVGWDCPERAKSIADSGRGCRHERTVEVRP